MLEESLIRLKIDCELNVITINMGVSLMEFVVNRSIKLMVIRIDGIVSLL